MAGGQRSPKECEQIQRMVLNKEVIDASERLFLFFSF